MYGTEHLLDIFILGETTTLSPTNTTATDPGNFGAMWYKILDKQRVLQ